MRSVLSLQNTIQCFQLWKQESWELPEGDVSFLQHGSSSLHFFLFLSIKLHIQICAGSVFRKANAGLPWGIASCSRIWRSMEEKWQIRIRISSFAKCIYNVEETVFIMPVKKKRGVTYVRETTQDMRHRLNCICVYEQQLCNILWRWNIWMKNNNQMDRKPKTSPEYFLYVECNWI